MHHRITAKFSLNTPLFSSGADETKPELRVSEIKAALRFWWRAMNYQLVDAASGNCQTLAARESELFGSTKGQSPFLLRVVANHVDALQLKSATELVANGNTRYLGYGLTETGANRFGKAADSGPTFTIELTLKPAACASQQEYVNVLKLFGMFGGLGYRSRRGFGSVTLQMLRIDDRDQALPTASADYEAVFASVLRDIPTAAATVAAPVYSAFVRDRRFCRVVLVNKPPQQFQTGIGALNAIAKAFKSLLTEIPAAGGSRLQNRVALSSPDDVSWAYLGLPRGYGKGSLDHKPKALSDRTDLKELDRRASPLLLHVYRDNASGTYGVVAILFKSDFLPYGYGVAASLGTAKSLPTPPANGYAWIDTWLDTIGTDI
ncbi:type III-B CRISPR module RAMP protein Cmr1 [Rhodoferax sp.]|uniref:type III-B CRISPR module RAMP protein Cmr1 n=1 Tax=Rhodoferax sp. TaxID=50421 RepID=UPI00263672EE|nr:type III-B CRISPR module RAMP protein Cmr1 [Rhodoferax sp.]MDD2919545.1 type III-B CRISPR module RAMP protein Cmr1 [Rhodoferax sp.]